MKLLFIGGPLDGNMKEMEDTRVYYEQSVPKYESLQAPHERILPTDGVVCTGATKVKYLRHVIRILDTAISVFAVEGLAHRDVLTYLIDGYQGMASDSPSERETDLTRSDMPCTLSGWQGRVGLKDMNQSTSKRRNEMPLARLTLTELNSDLYDQISEGIDRIRQKIIEAYADGTISFSEIVAVIGEAVRELLLLVNTLQVLTPEQKKAAVLELVDEIYAKDIAPIDVPVVPDWMEPMMDQIVGQIIHIMALQVLNFLLSTEEENETCPYCRAAKAPLIAKEE